MEPIIIKKFEMTCEASPSQWECETEDGRFVYIRYRFGNFTASLGKTHDEAICGHTLMQASFYGDNEQFYYHGEMSTERMIELTKDILDFSGKTVIDQYHLKQIENS